MQIVEKYLDIDMSELLAYDFNLFPGTKIELKLLEYYKFYTNEDNDPYKLFTRYLLKRIYKDDVIRDTSEIFKFYSVNKYIACVMGFINRIDYLILNKTRLINFVNIEFNKVTKLDKETLEIRFLITLRKEKT